MAKKHTPGPWRTDDKTGAWVSSESHPCVAFVYVSRDENNDQPIGDDERLANARLIASAPNLLENLEYIASCLPDGNFDDGEIVELSITGKAAKDILAALQKAQG